MSVLIIFGFGIVVFALFVAGVFMDSKQSIDDSKKTASGRHTRL